VRHNIDQMADMNEIEFNQHAPSPAPPIGLGMIHSQTQMRADIGAHVIGCRPESGVHASKTNPANHSRSTAPPVPNKGKRQVPINPRILGITMFHD
jgi:hypothetical protein